MKQNGTKKVTAIAIIEAIAIVVIIAIMSFTPRKEKGYSIDQMKAFEIANLAESLKTDSVEVKVKRNILVKAPVYTMKFEFYYPYTGNDSTVRYKLLKY